MTDVFTSRKRTAIMQAIRGKDSKPEVAVRRLAHSLGYRYRLHVSELPGKPDLVFPSRRRIILVHGCFWHRHNCRKGRSLPSTRARFWREKLDRNKLRDATNRRRLRRLGWDVLVIWECQVKNTGALAEKITHFLG